MRKGGARLGFLGERVAEGFLIGKGFRVLDRNFSVRYGEIDLIADDGEMIVFVEVKTRRSLRFGAPLEAISPRKLERVAIAAAYWLRRHHHEERNYRFAVMGIVYAGLAPQITYTDLQSV